MFKMGGLVRKCERKIIIYRYILAFYKADLSGKKNKQNRYGISHPFIGVNIYCNIQALYN